MTTTTAIWMLTQLLLLLLLPDRLGWSHWLLWCPPAS